MTEQELKARIAELEASNKRLVEKALAKQTLSFKVGEKGGLSVYGLGRFPVTLYIGQWERLIAKIPDLQTFAKAHASELTVKE